MEHIFTKTFKSELKKYTQNKQGLKTRAEECISDFIDHLFDSQYYRKPLKWYPKDDVHELQVGWDARIIIQFFRKDDMCYYLNFGTHASLNLKSDKKLRIRKIKG